MCPGAESDLAPGALPLLVVLRRVRCKLVLHRDPQPPGPASLQAVLHRGHLWQVPRMQQVFTERKGLVLIMFYFLFIRPISDKALRALDHSWHVVCFVCKVDVILRESWKIRLIYFVRSVEFRLRARRVSTRWTVTQSVASVLETQDRIKYL